RIEFTVLGLDTQPLEGVVLTVSATEKSSFEKTFTSDDQGRIVVLLLDGTIPYHFRFESEGFVPAEDVLKLKLLPEKNFKTVTLTTRQAAAGPVQTAASAAREAYNTGVRLVQEKKDGEAIAQFEKALELEPDLTAAHSALAKMYSRAENWPSAIEHAEMAINLAGDDPDLHRILAVSWEKRGDEEKAAHYRAKAPADPAAIFNQAVPHLNAGRDDKAEPLLEQALAADETFARAHYELGSLYARTGRNTETKKHLARYLELDPNGEFADVAKGLLEYLP
ncbi:MAG TPA: tetratricopeptide repeat protein, partial [Thermoanaerobaculia bacterium]|nr:tetratricopeptide repeat protein [Thermoanaerobaculia bacterium]